MQLLHLTDCHLFADQGATLKGVPTRAAFVETLGEARRRFPECHRVVISGDLAHDEIEPTYQALRELLGDWVDRCRLLPGNHDNRAAMRQVFGDIVPRLIHGEQRQEEGPIVFSEPLGRWRLIGLDSHVPGEVPGRVSPAQLKWMQEDLYLHADSPTVLFLHHPPVLIGTEWLDAIGLLEPQRLIQIIHAAPQVRLVCCGHVHMEHESAIGAATFVSTPSMVLQFKPRGRQGELDSIPPGFRVIELADDFADPATAVFQTRVVRLDRLTYPPQANEG
jgi:Icc protein